VLFLRSLPAASAFPQMNTHHRFAQFRFSAVVTRHFRPDLNPSTGSIQSPLVLTVSSFGRLSVWRNRSLFRDCEVARPAACEQTTLRTPLPGLPFQTLDAFRWRLFQVTLVALSRYRFRLSAPALSRLFHPRRWGHLAAALPAVACRRGTLQVCVQPLSTFAVTRGGG
jgi:hypothetical protein